MKVKIKLEKETPRKVILKFPTIKIPIEVSRRYFKRIQESDKYEILRKEVMI